MSLQQLSSHLMLFKSAITLDLLAFMIDVIVAVLLFDFFRKQYPLASKLMLSFRLIAHPAIGSINLLNQWMAAVFISNQPESSDLIFSYLEAHQLGYLMAGVFFGVHCVLLGWLIYYSKGLPQWLGILMIMAGLTYWIESFGLIYWPHLKVTLSWIVGLGAAIGEISLSIYLIIKSTKFGAQSSSKLKLS